MEETAGEMVARFVDYSRGMLRDGRGSSREMC